MIQAAGHAFCPLHCPVLTVVFPVARTAGTSCLSSSLSTLDNTYLENESIVVVRSTSMIQAAGHAFCPLHCPVLTVVLPVAGPDGTSCLSTSCVSTPDNLSVAAINKVLGLTIVSYYM